MTASVIQKAIMDSVSSTRKVVPVATDSVEGANAIAAFETTMSRTREIVDKVSAPPSISPVDHHARNIRIAQVEVPSTDLTAASSSNERQQTIRAMELSKDAKVNPTTEGDAILSGLKKLQGVFADREQQLNQTIESPSLSAQSLMRIQMDMVQYTLMIDVASKVSGKLTQSVDSLVKGQ
jgi:type III secretion system YscI/HrpB-like protein